jgi:hypothetical protein
LLQKGSDGCNFFFDTTDLNDFITLKSRCNIDGSLINKVGVLFEAKSLDNFSLYTFLIAIVWSRSKAHTELLFNKLCEVLWLIKHKSIGLIKKDQRVLLWFERTTNVITNLILAFSQAPQIFKVSFVALH